MWNQMELGPFTFYFVPGRTDPVELGESLGN